VFLETPVHNPNRCIRQQAGLSVAHQKRSALNGHPLRQMAVMAEDPAAVADGEDRRNDLHSGSVAGLPEFFQPPEVVGRLLAKRVKTARKHGSVQPAAGGSLQDLREFGHVAVLAQAPSEKSDETFRVGRGEAVAAERGCQSKQ